MSSLVLGLSHSVRSLQKSEICKYMCMYVHVHVQVKFSFPKFLPHSLMLNQLFFRGGNVFNLDLINPELKKKKKKYVNSGVLHFVSVQ